MDEYKSAPEVVHHGALLGACYMVDLLQDTEQMCIRDRSGRLPGFTDTGGAV